jgi:hypothetical protein
MHWFRAIQWYHDHFSNFINRGDQNKFYKARPPYDGGYCQKSKFEAIFLLLVIAWTGLANAYAYYFVAINLHNSMTLKTPFKAFTTKKDLLPPKNYFRISTSGRNSLQLGHIFKPESLFCFRLESAFRFSSESIFRFAKKFYYFYILLKLIQVIDE